MNPEPDIQIQETTHQPEAPTQSNLANNVVGCVKWFNNRHGYGFIVTEGVNAVNYGDVFVHHSQIKITDLTTYKYLALGECVKFDLVSVPNGTHKFQASNVTGFCGKLSCENPSSTYRRPTRRFDDNEVPTPRTPRPVTRISSATKTDSKAFVDAITNKPTSSEGFVLPKSRKPKAPTPVQQPPAPSPYKNAINHKPSLKKN
jgi:cold shock CspA family protein